MAYRYCLMFALALATLPALPCSVYVPRKLYINVVRLEGPPIAGLKWVRVHNVLDYEGDERVLVSILFEGKRVPVAKWQDGQECGYDETGAETCSPNQPFAGIGLQGFFGNWGEAADQRDSLKKLFLPLIVEIGGREFQHTLRSWPVRSTRDLSSERSKMLASQTCELMNSEQP